MEDSFSILDPRMETEFDRATGKSVPNQRIITAHREFWSRCGDLIKAKPNHVAKCFMRVFLNIRLSPQALKKALGRVPALPPHLAEDGLPYAFQSCKKPGDAEERITRVVPIEFV